MDHVSDEVNDGIPRAPELACKAPRPPVLSLQQWLLPGGNCPDHIALGIGDRRRQHRLGPLVTRPLGGFGGVNTGQANGDSLPLTTGHTNCVAITNRYQSHRTRAQPCTWFRGRSTTAVTVSVSCLAVGVTPL